MSTLDPTILLVLGVAAGLLIGATLVWLLQRSRLRRLADDAALQRQQLAEQTETLNTLNYQLATARVHQPGEITNQEIAVHIQHLEDTLEQRDLELRIVRQDFELETKILKHEIEHTRHQLEEERRALMHGRATVEFARDVLARQSERLASLEQTLGQREMELTQSGSGMRKRYSHEPIPVPRLAHPEGLAQPDRGASVRTPKTERPTFRSLHALLEGIPVTTSGAAAVSPAAPAPSDARPMRQRHDDLTQIWGIDEATQATLYARGLTTFADIARLAPRDVEAIAEVVEQDARQIQRHWIAQAQLLQYSAS